jgi:hypothetical protein
LSLFPQPDKAPSPRVLAAHRVRPLQRSKTAPAPSPGRESFVEGVPEPKNQSAKHVAPSASEDDGMKTQLLTPTPSSRGSFDSEVEEIPIMVDGPTKIRGRYDEPEWEILSKPQRNAASHNQQPSSAPLEPSSVEKRAQAQVAEAVPRSADAITTIGIARSISVSRTQKPDMLKPTLLRVATTGSERLVDKKPLTPTLVELQNRKSQRVQLVDA